MTDQEPRCWRCEKKIANYAGRPWSIDCHRCHAKNRSQGAEIVLTAAEGNVSLNNK